MSKIQVTHPEKKMTDFRSAGTGKKLLRQPYHEERLDGPLRLVQLCTGVAITKDYGPYEMTYSSANRFGKYSKTEGSMAPSKPEIHAFKRDMNRAAASGDPEIRAFLDRNPDLKIESWRL